MENLKNMEVEYTACTAQFSSSLSTQLQQLQELTQFRQKDAYMAYIIHDLTVNQNSLVIKYIL